MVLLIVLSVLIIMLIISDFDLTKIWRKLQGEGTIFVYHNITFRKIFVGKHPLYETDLLIYRSALNDTVYWKLRLENDPRKLERIPANITSKLERKVYVSFTKEIMKCEAMMLTSYRFGEFLAAVGCEREAAAANGELAEELAKQNKTYKVKNCDNIEEGASVILLKESSTNYSNIYQQDRCYILEIANCEHVAVSERFFLALIDLMRKF